MRFESYPTTRTSSFYTPEIISPRMEAAKMFEDSDIIVYKAMMDSMTATYHGIACNSPEIVREGLGDMAKSAWEFFKKIGEKIINFMKNAFNYLMSYIGDFEDFIEKYKDNESKFKEFQVSGFDYTISEFEINTDPITEFISEFNSTVGKIKDMETEKVQKLIADELAKDKISVLRGKLCGTSSVKRDRFADALKKKLRNGKGSKGTIKVNSSSIGSMIEDFKALKKAIPDIKEESFNIKDGLDEMADFFKNAPQYEYKDSSHKEIHSKTISFDKEKGAKIEDKGKEEYSADNYKKLTMYYNFCFKLTKELSSIYTTAYSEKISAAKEALSFYKTTIRQALSPFADREKEAAVKDSTDAPTISIDQDVTDTVNEGRDYVIDAMDNHEAMLEQWVNGFNQYINETNIMAEAYLQGRVILQDMLFEDVQVVNKAGNTEAGEKADRNSEGFFASIVRFFRDLIDKFTEAAKAMISSNQEWFEENNWRLKELASNKTYFDNIAVTLVDYNEDRYKDSIVDGTKKVDTYEKSTKKYTEVEMAKEMYPKMTVMSKSSDIKEGAKIWFRGGDSGNNVKKYTGGDAHALFVKMVNYCEKYNKEVDNIKTICKNKADVIEAKQEELEKESANEAMGILSEGVPLTESGLSLLPWYDSTGKAQFIIPVTEAETDKKEDRGEGTKSDESGTVQKLDEKGQPVQDKPPANATAAQKEKMQEENKQKKEEANQGKKNALMFYNIQKIVAAAMLTIAEEQYAEYVKTMKGIVASKLDVLKKKEQDTNIDKKREEEKKKK